MCNTFLVSRIYRVRILITTTPYIGMFLSVNVIKVNKFDLFQICTNNVVSKNLPISWDNFIDVACHFRRQIYLAYRPSKKNTKETIPEIPNVVGINSHNNAVKIQNMLFFQYSGFYVGITRSNLMNFNIIIKAKNAQWYSSTINKHNI